MMPSESTAPAPPGAEPPPAAELDASLLDSVAGGLNPQPLPPRYVRD